MRTVRVKLKIFDFSRYLGQREKQLPVPQNQKYKDSGRMVNNIHHPLTLKGKQKVWFVCSQSLLIQQYYRILIYYRKKLGKYVMVFAKIQGPKD